MNLNYFFYSLLIRVKPLRKLMSYWRLRRKHEHDTFSFQSTTVGILILFVIPWLIGGYQYFQLANACIYALALVGLNLLTGYNGQLSIGHGAFFGMGAFAMTIMTSRWQINYGLAIPMSTLLMFVVGLIFGVPALRLEREKLSLALATFSLAVVFPQLLIHFESWTGGTSGLKVTEPLPPEIFASWGVSQDLWLYLICLSILLVGLYLNNNLLHSRTGRAIRAIKDQDFASESVGINNARYRVLSFGISAALTGTAGALSALLVGHVAPESFGESLSVNFLAALVVGGMGTQYGPLYGAIFLQYLPPLTEKISPSMTATFFGAAMIALVWSDAAGTAGLMHTLRTHFKTFFSYIKF